MEIDRDLLVITIVGGVLTFGTYYYAYQSGKGNTLWAGVKPKHRHIYGISGILAGLVFLYLFYYYIFYLNKKTKNFKTIVDVSIGLITFASATWVPLTFLGLKNRKYRFLSIIALLLVAIGSLMLVISTALANYNETDKEKHIKHDTRWVLALISGSIFAFHVTFLDLLSWGPLYLDHIRY